VLRYSSTTAHAPAVVLTGGREFVIKPVSRLNRDYRPAASHAKVVGHAGRLAPRTPEQPFSDVVHLPSAERLLRDRLERVQNTAASVAAMPAAMARVFYPVAERSFGGAVVPNVDLVQRRRELWVGK
jgi:hypothetical protein